MARVVVLAGPSCVGKSPLARALTTVAPDLSERLSAPVLYNSRAPRPAERDGVEYHFRTREFLDGLREQPGYLVMDVRRDVHALSWADLWAPLELGRDVFFEGNPFVGAAISEAARARGLELLSVFVSPVSARELIALREVHGEAAAEAVADIMRRKLRRRTLRQKGSLDAEDERDIQARCRSAWTELGYAPQFDWVLPNHDGEDSENWDAFGVLLGDARRSTLALAALLRGEPSDVAERWTADLLVG